jgi:hypothetical protein
MRGFIHLVLDVQIMATSYVVYYDTEEEKSRILAAMLEHNGSRDKGQVIKPTSRVLQSSLSLKACI